MKKSLISFALTTSVVLTGVSAVAAAEIPQTTLHQHLKPGQAGYVGALNDRPSNAPTSTSKNSKQPAIITPNNAGYWYQVEPASINVLIRPNNDPSATSTTVVNYDFGYYLDNVLPNEWYSTWPTAAIEAGAVSVRSYAWYCDNNPKYADLGAALDNTTNSQVFKPGTAVTSTNNAISATHGEAVIYGTTEEPGYYKAGTYSSARDSSSYNFNNNVYQNGTDYEADQNESYTWILSYFYPGTTLVTGSGY